jgi:hypothetical protein
MPIYPNIKFERDLNGCHVTSQQSPAGIPIPVTTHHQSSPTHKLASAFSRQSKSLKKEWGNYVDRGLFDYLRFEFEWEDGIAFVTKEEEGWMNLGKVLPINRAYVVGLSPGNVASLPFWLRQKALDDLNGLLLFYV